MAKDNIIRKSVAFNPDDPDELELFQHANKRTNFSRYIKTLIYRDKHGIHPTSKDLLPEEPDYITKELAEEWT